ncbi:hypothetical protein F0U62_27465 [Cystobacter fuscus]|nr:hypothetical protein F0U62_27465 [Cystobacter fuscus]
MNNDEWNEEDDFYLEIHSPDNPLDRGFEGLEELLIMIESLDECWRPDRIFSGRHKRKYSRQVLWKHLQEMAVGSCIMFTLDRTKPPDVSVHLSFQQEQKPDRLSLDLRVSPFSLVREEHSANTYAERILSLVRAFAQRYPISHGLGHSWVDYCMGVDLNAENPFDRSSVREEYWLSVYGPRLLEQFGHDRVLSTPASHIETLPGGAVLLLTRPTPADFDSEEARQAQARALVHLRPELKLETTLDTLRQRSRVFVPIPVHFDEDVADILHKKVAFEGLENKRRLVERFNLYRPPPVSEWLPAEKAPVPDVEDVKQAIDTYERLYAEQLVALMHSQQVPEATEGTLEALAAVDFALWHLGWGARFTAEEKEALIPALGAWLGMYLVSVLGGQWVPRRKLEEAAVRVGDRAWLPFLRARHALGHGEAPLDYSCSQFFRQAQRSIRPTA